MTIRAVKGTGWAWKINPDGSTHDDLVLIELGSVSFEGVTVEHRHESHNGGYSCWCGEPMPDAHDPYEHSVSDDT